MHKQATKAAVLLLIALLATCWAVGEAWHLVPGLSHFNGQCDCHSADTGSQDTVFAAACHCTHCCFGHCAICSLQIIAVGERPISCLFDHLNTCGAIASAIELPRPTYSDCEVLPPVCWLDAVIRATGVRAPPF